MIFFKSEDNNLKSVQANQHNSNLPEVIILRRKTYPNQNAAETVLTECKWFLYFDRLDKIFYAIFPEQFYV